MSQIPVCKVPLRGESPNFMGIRCEWKPGGNKYCMGHGCDGVKDTVPRASPKPHVSCKILNLHSSTEHKFYWNIYIYISSKFVCLVMRREHLLLVLTLTTAKISSLSFSSSQYVICLKKVGFWNQQTIYNGLLRRLQWESANLHIAKELQASHNGLFILGHIWSWAHLDLKWALTSALLYKVGRRVGLAI